MRDRMIELKAQTDLLNMKRKHTQEEKSTLRADIGERNKHIRAVQSRFGATIANLEISSENTEAARARIVDADFAQETAQLARQQILQNAGTAMVAQANAVPEQVLSLLKGI